jgi:hypothetical protein
MFIFTVASNLAERSSLLAAAAWSNISSGVYVRRQETISSALQRRVPYVKKRRMGGKDR